MKASGDNLRKDSDNFIGLLGKFLVECLCPGLIGVA